MPLPAGRHANPFSRVGKPLPTGWARRRHLRDRPVVRPRYPCRWPYEPAPPEEVEPAFPQAEMTETSRDQ